MYIYDIDTPNEPKLEEVINLNFYGFFVAIIAVVRLIEKISTARSITASSTSSFAVPRGDKFEAMYILISYTDKQIITVVQELIAPAPA